MFCFFCLFLCSLVIVLVLLLVVIVDFIFKSYFDMLKVVGLCIIIDSFKYFGVVIVIDVLML